MLKRPRQSLSSDIKKALVDRGLMTKYKERPAYQRNDYLCWIKEAVRPETRKKRLGVMLKELRGGKKYMNMNWHSK